jgi:hypothetical protein
LRVGTPLDAPTEKAQQENTVKKLDRKKLVLDCQTLRLLEARQLDDVVGGLKNPTRGICGTTCTSDVVCIH